MNHDSPAAIRELLGDLGIRLKKRWGQNYLINRGAREGLVTHLDTSPGMRIWEIGPGLGSMTEMLLDQSPESVTVFEIDRKVITYLQGHFGSDPRFRLVPGDVLRTWSDEKHRAGLPDRLLGNLPYASSSAIIVMLTRAVPDLSIFTVQKELAERMISLPGAKNYSSFSVICQHAFLTVRLGDLRPGSFYPAPDVVSSIVALRPSRGKRAVDGDVFDRFVRRAFQNRRKTIRNNIVAGEWPTESSEVLDVITDCGLDHGRRAEEYPVEAYIEVADRLSELFRERPAL